MDYGQVPERLRTGNRVKVVESFEGLHVGSTGQIIGHNFMEVRVQFDMGIIMSVSIKTADRCLVSASRMTG